MQEDLSTLAVHIEIKKEILVYAVVVVEIVGAELVVPHCLARIGIAGENAGRPLVVSRTLLRVPWARICGSVIDQIQFGIIRDPAPGGSPTNLPHSRGP